MLENAEPRGALPVSPILRACIAACLTGAAVIHFAMVPSHMSEWSVEGVTFVVAGWIQVALAIAVVVRPRRWVLELIAVTSAVLIGAWVVTRTTGAPFGPHSGHAEAVTFIDLVCIGLEGSAIALSALAWFRPRAGERWNAEKLVFASIIPVAALVLATTAVASPSASHHAHDSHGTDSATGTGTDCVTESDGHTHCTEATTVDDKGFALLGNGHHHAIVAHDLDPATQAELDRQLAITREVAAMYPTVAAAEAAGYRRAGPYSPGLGAHYTKSGIAEMNPSGIMTDEVLLHPQSLQFAGNEPDSEIAGFMYYSASKIEPVGFPGTNDVWHYHTNICIKMSPDGIDAPLGADRDDVTSEMCQAVGGFLLQNTSWMVHVWSLPGWENPSGGVFAEEHPMLGCSDGTYFTVPTDETPANRLNNCASGAPANPLAYTAAGS